MSQTLHIVRGIPCSGKSTYATRWVQQSPLTRARINRDDIRFMNFGAYVLPHELENTVSKLELAALEALLAAGKSVVMDNQNLRAKYVKPYLELAKRYNVVVTHKDFPIELKVALSRNAERERQVPEGVIKKLHSSFHKFPEFPTLEDSSAFFARYVPDETLPKAILLDVDGTAMKISPDRGPFEWSKVLLDEPNAPVVETVKALSAAGYKIIVMSGRDEICKEDTSLSLREAGIEFEEIHMRPEADGRPDWKVKGELFDNHIRSRYNIVFCLDDRDQVVDFYRKTLGLTVFQVEYGRF